MTISDHANVWTRHWATGAAHSCTGSFGPVYGGAMAGFWRDVHARTRAGASILDLATGGGAVPRLLVALRPDLPCDIVGVDVAAAPHDWLSTLPPSVAARVSFRAGIAAEALPVPARSVDLVTSQFGIEYGDRVAVQAEILRVLAPGGHVAAVMHHASARPVQLAAVEIGHLDWLTAPDGLWTAARRMIRPLSRASTPEGRAALAVDADAEAARRAFNRAQDGLNERARMPDGADILHDVRDAATQVLDLALTTGHAAAESAWASLDLQLADSRFRLAALMDSALDGHALDRWLATFRDHGLTCDAWELRDGDVLWGWAVHARALRDAAPPGTP